MNRIGGINISELTRKQLWISRIYLGGSLFASALFYLGSLMLFPFVFSITDGIWYSSSMFLLGSAIMFVSYVLEALHSWIRCRTTWKGVLIQVLSLIGWLGMLAGSILGSPNYDLRFHRDMVYLGAISVILLPQVIKMVLLVTGSSLPLRQIMARYTIPFYSQAYMTIAMALYMLGTLFFIKSAYHPSLTIIAPPFYVFAAMTMIISKVYLWKGLAENKQAIRSTKQLIEYEQKSCQIGTQIKSAVRMQDKTNVNRHSLSPEIE